jgi:hypothetical protein
MTLAITNPEASNMLGVRVSRATKYPSPSAISGFT